MILKYSKKRLKHVGIATFVLFLISFIFILILGITNQFSPPTNEGKGPTGTGAFICSDRLSFNHPEQEDYCSLIEFIWNDMIYLYIVSILFIISIFFSIPPYQYSLFIVIVLCVLYIFFEKEHSQLDKKN